LETNTPAPHASRARLARVPLLGPRSAAVLAGVRSLVGELFFGAERGFFERDDDLFFEVLAVARPNAEPTEEVAEDPVHVEAAEVDEVEAAVDLVARTVDAR